MIRFLNKIKNMDFAGYAVISLLVLWTSLTFSIALTEISFVCALIFWIGWHIQLKKGIACPGPDDERAGRGDAGGSSACLRKIDWAFWTPLALFFIFVLISFFTSEYPKQSFQGLYKIARPLLAFVMAGELFRDAHSQKRFEGVFLAAFLLVMVDSSIQYVFGKDLLRGFSAEQSGAGIRLVGPFGNFAKMATYLVLVIPVFGMRFWSDFLQPEQRKKSFYALALAFAGVILLYLTRCRGPVAALGLSLGFLFLYKRWFKILGIALLLGVLLLALSPREVIIHQDGKGKEQSISERYYLWRRAIDVIIAKPLTGTGINTYDRAHAKYDTVRQKRYISVSPKTTTFRQNPNGSVSFISSESAWTSDEKQHSIIIKGQRYYIHRDPEGGYAIWNDYVSSEYYAHNGYLQLAAEIGLPGIFCFLGFLFMFFRKALRALRSIRGSSEEYTRLGLLTGLLAFLFYAAGDNNLQSPPSLMFFWFTAGILMARQNASDPEAVSSK